MSDNKLLDVCSIATKLLRLKMSKTFLLFVQMEHFTNVFHKKID